MADPVLDDPGELLRFWLWYQKRQTVRGVMLVNLAQALQVDHRRVSAWLARNGIPSCYWNPIARSFDLQSYRDIEDEAKALWQHENNRRGYTPLYQLQSRKQRKGLSTTTIASGTPRRTPAEMPLVADAIADSIDAAKRPNPLRRSARRSKDRKTHETQAGA
jgi:hypothetical protein